ncbi:MAG: hypothetical protein OHK0015_03870 [Chloroflexi bacterium OHK40]
MTSSDPTRRRRRQWALRGALILAALAILLGTTFNVLVAVAIGEATTDSGTAYWAWLLLRSVVLWGVGALPFGAILGVFASMIWRDDDAGQI